MATVSGEFFELTVQVRDGTMHEATTLYSDIIATDGTRQPQLI